MRDRTAERRQAEPQEREQHLEHRALPPRPRARPGRSRNAVAWSGTGKAYAAPSRGRQRRSSSALPTTLTLLSAIAAPASTGLSNPAAASGIPSAL